MATVDTDKNAYSVYVYCMKSVFTHIHIVNMKIVINVYMKVYNKCIYSLQYTF